MLDGLRRSRISEVLLASPQSAMRHLSSNLSSSEIHEPILQETPTQLASAPFER
jgi:hypothetical protein